VRPRLRAALSEAWQLVRGYAGEQAYERYVAHLAVHHPGERPLPEREFWRRHTDRGDTHPAARCC
jgi:uncharacterized short protein YbdD (DUF466 family)